MSSERQKAASRANGKLSHGPTSPEGKARSAMNARRHGFLSKIMVIEPEYKESFDTVVQEHLDRFPDLDGVELGMLEEMSVCHWRLRRIWTIEKVWMEQEIGRDTAD